MLIRASLTALVLSLGACTVATNPTPSVSRAEPAAPPPPIEAKPVIRPETAPLARAEPVREAGLESGFTHCCGDVDYAMQVDCSERLLRCYESDGQSWRQTYGRNCKEALGQGCYEQGCIAVCE